MRGLFRTPSKGVALQFLFGGILRHEDVPQEGEVRNDPGRGYRDESSSVGGSAQCFELVPMAIDY